MTEQPVATQPVATTEGIPAESPSPKKRPSKRRLMVIGIVVAVVLVECLGVYFLFPGTADAKAPASPKVHSEKSEKEKDKEDKKGKESKESKSDKERKTETLLSADQVEVELGPFTVMSFQPVSNATMRINVRIYGVVAKADEELFSTRMKEIQHRFRDQTIVILRGADENDLADAGLGLLKRTILEKTNVLLGKPLLQEIIFSDFSFIVLP